MAKKQAKKSDALYGGSISGDFESAETDFVKVHEQVVKEGDTMTMQIDGSALNTERGCLTVFDNSDESMTSALTVFFEHHPDAMYQDGPTDAQRLGNAVARCVGPITSNEALHETCAAGGLVLTVTGTTYNGGFARLWSVDRS
jgi:hypothetical protein